MKEKKLATSDFHLRIKKTTVRDMCNDCMETGRFETFNEMFNKCLEIALPQIMEQQVSNTFTSRVERMEAKILSKVDRESKAIRKAVTKQMVLQQTSEMMLSTILQLFIYFANTQGVTISDAMIDTFIETLPPRFIEIKQYYVQQLLDEQGRP